MATERIQMENELRNRSEAPAGNEAVVEALNRRFDRRAMFA